MMTWQCEIYSCVRLYLFVFWQVAGVISIFLHVNRNFWVFFLVYAYNEQLTRKKKLWQSYQTFLNVHLWLWRPGTSVYLTHTAGVGYLMLNVYIFSREGLFQHSKTLYKGWVVFHRLHAKYFYLPQAITLNPLLSLFFSGSSIQNTIICYIQRCRKMRFSWLVANSVRSHIHPPL